MIRLKDRDDKTTELTTKKYPLPFSLLSSYLCGFNRMFGVLLALIFAIIIIAPLSAISEDIVYDKSLDIQKNILSPFCPGRLLYDCPSEQATQLKIEIEKKLQSGQTEEEVIAEVQAKHPEAQYAAPPTHGKGLLVWLMPIIIFVILILVGGIWIRRQITSHKN